MEHFLSLSLSLARGGFFFSAAVFCVSASWMLHSAWIRRCQFLFIAACTFCCRPLYDNKSPISALKWTFFFFAASRLIHFELEPELANVPRRDYRQFLRFLLGCLSPSVDKLPKCNDRLEKKEENFSAAAFCLNFSRTCRTFLNFFFFFFFFKKKKENKNSLCWWKVKNPHADTRYAARIFFALIDWFHVEFGPSSRNVETMQVLRRRPSDFEIKF